MIPMSRCRHRCRAHHCHPKYMLPILTKIETRVFRNICRTKQKVVMCFWSGWAYTFVPHGDTHRRFHWHTNHDTSYSVHVQRTVNTALMHLSLHSSPLNIYRNTRAHTASHFQQKKTLLPRRWIMKIVLFMNVNFWSVEDGPRMQIDIIMLWHEKFLLSWCHAFWISLSELDRELVSIVSKLRRLGKKIHAVHIYFLCQYSIWGTQIYNFKKK